MTTKRYCVYMIPASHRAAGNLLMAFVNGDSPASNAFRVAANPSSSADDPVTHYYGGMSVTEDWLAQVSSLATDIVPLPDGTAWSDFGATEAEAVAAAQAMHLQVTITQDDSEPSPQVTLANALAALELKSVVWPD